MKPISFFFFLCQLVASTPYLSPSIFCTFILKVTKLYLVYMAILGSILSHYSTILGYVGCWVLNIVKLNGVWRNTLTSPLFLSSSLPQ